MKTLLPLLAFAALSVPAVFAKEEAKKPDLFESGLRQVMEDHRKGDDEAVVEKLRILLKMMEEKGAKKVGDLLPEQIEAWKGESLKQDDLAVLGGGVSMSRVYASGKKQVTVKVIKDSPLVKQLIPLIGNEELMKLANRKTYSISGETAAMEGEKKLQLVVDQRILVELLANGEAEEKDLVALARKLDLNALAKMK
ncbi:hypothetical protein OKA05_17565 [Luteolibacter arcticus]|uniref:DUF4252 domain-containing protein n=1 Tax=Luteolibacter arcticus TaxID=1581411 RepID=A0ABT3GLI9_9BACT|nr:hypothetical protein [Luteolibacter arcticus]MCW1924379.1 hypothetical protein [Luteolibacter arcticus]